MRTESKATPWLFASPALIVFGLVVIFPVIWTLVLSLYKWDGISPMRFIGLKNYAKLFKDYTFHQAVVNNLSFCAISTATQFVMGMLLAMLLSSIRKFRNLLKVTYFVPCIVSTVALSQIFIKLLALEPMGVFNVLLSVVGVQPRSFLGSQDTALYTLALVDAYKYCGIYMVIFYSALVGVSEDVLEAATIDGCGWFRQYFEIKLPMIKGVCGLALVMLINGTLKAFEMPYVLTNGGPGTSSEMVSTYMYRTAFSKMNYGYASTVAVFLLLECLVGVSIVRRMLPKADVE